MLAFICRHTLHLMAAGTLRQLCSLIGLAPARSAPFLALAAALLDHDDSLSKEERAKMLATVTELVARRSRRRAAPQQHYGPDVPEDRAFPNSDKALAAGALRI